MASLVLAVVMLGGGGYTPTDVPLETPTVPPVATEVGAVQSMAGPRATSGASLSGSATWYRWRPGQAAAGPLLRRYLGAHWRGRTITVCSRRCIRVRLTDWCLCSHGRRLVDLDARSFRMLAPLAVGVLSVTVR